MRSLLFLSALVFETVAAYSWKNVKIGGGGGFIPGIVFHPTAKNVAYARADIGGLYKLNTDDSWTPLLDSANDTTWHNWGIDALAIDPMDSKRVYVAVGMYTNSWDPNNGSILASGDQGKTWSETKLPFKVGGNMPGRGMGERLAVDPKNNKIIYFGARSGNGLWKSIDKGKSFQKVTSFTATGTYVSDATDTSGLGSDINGLSAVTFDTSSPLLKGATSRIYVGTADTNSSTWVSNDAGTTWSLMAGQPTGVFPHKMKFSSAEKALYITYNSDSGPYSGGTGSVYRVANGTFKNITPAWVASNGISMGFGGLALDAQAPGTLMVSALNLWWPDVQIFRSNDSGTTWTNAWDFDYQDGQTQKVYYTQETSKAPWITAQRGTDSKVLGWMVEALEIDPLDSNHWLYGTGLTLYGGHNLKSWPSVKIFSLADGIEEESVQALITPPGLNIPLISAVGDDAGFIHKSLTVAPSDSIESPLWATINNLDYAGSSPENIVRIGNNQLATSNDTGATWLLTTSVPATASGGSLAFAADASAIVWTSSAGSLRVIANVSSNLISSLPSGAAVVADKVNAKYFYAATTTGVYVSSDAGLTFNFSIPLTSYNSIKMAAHPAIAGDFWVSTSQGIYHSTDFGKTVTQSTGVTGGMAIAVGKGAKNTTSVYAFAGVGGSNALRKTADLGKSWSVIQTASTGFGSASSNCLAASWETEDLVFVGTNGRGIFYGLP